MITFDTILMCDDMTEAQFQKINLTGLLVSRIFVLSDLPYTLQTAVVVLGSSDGATSTADITLAVSFRDAGGVETLREHPFFHHTLTTGTDNTTVVIRASLSIEFSTTGVMSITVFVDGVSTLSAPFPITTGKAPKVNLSAPIRPAGVLFGSSPFDVHTLFARASDKLVLIDQYLDPVALMDALSVIPANAQVLVLAAPDSKRPGIEAAYRAHASVNTFPQRVVIKFARDFHDRFIIINDAEYYHFGHSVKDLAGGRISRYSKMADHSEISELQTQFAVAWAAAKPL